ncbi:hypothetical protein [Enterococcus sp. AZ109]|uniref:hypothetical protein n=1 Tax=Enterococcus sp. AZ109 TaxID=2774634 RepID=UPI003F20E5A7
MVSMKEIFENFVSKRYKPFSRKPFTSQSFAVIIYGYLFLLGLMIVCRWAGNQDNLFDTQTNIFLDIQVKGILTVVVLASVGLFLFKLPQLKKFAVVIAYGCGMGYPFFIAAFFTCITDNPIKYATYGGLLIILGWLLGIFIHLFLVITSIKQNSMNIRDVYADYYVNILGIIAISSMIYGFTFDSDFFIQVGIMTILTAMLVVGTFNFPRILPYWRGEEDKPEVSMYGKSLSMMKRGKKND